MLFHGNPNYCATVFHSALAMNRSFKLAVMVLLLCKHLEKGPLNSLFDHRFIDSEDESTVRVFSTFQSK